MSKRLSHLQNNKWAYYNFIESNRGLGTPGSETKTLLVTETTIAGVLA